MGFNVEENTNALEVSNETLYRFLLPSHCEVNKLLLFLILSFRKNGRRADT